MQQRETGTGQRHWSSIGEETFVGGMWLLYMLFRIGGRLPFRVVLYPVVLWYWATNRARRASGNSGSVARMRSIHAGSSTSGRRSGSGK